MVAANPARLEIGAIAARARAWVTRSGPRRVRGVHLGVLYLEDAEGLLALTTADVPLTPLSAQLAPGMVLPPATPTTDATDWVFELGHARPWEARPDWSALDGAALAAQNQDARRLAEARLLAEAPAVLAAAGGPLPLELLGLGPGLTPAGDDVLVGRLHALHAGLLPTTGLQVDTLLAAARTRTTRLSQAFLEAAAAGECSAPWQDLWPTPGAVAGSRRSVIRVILGMGQTSGAAALWGFLTAGEARPHHAP